MWYLLGEIAFLLIVAIAIGIGIGWLLWSWRRVPMTRQEFSRLMADRTELYRIRMGGKLQPSLLDQMSRSEERPPADGSSVVEDRPRPVPPERAAPQLIKMLPMEQDEEFESDESIDLVDADIKAALNVDDPEVANGHHYDNGSGSSDGSGSIGLPADATVDLRGRGGSAPMVERDDLTAIDGVSPEIERILLDRGVADYRQVGSLTDEQIDELETFLPGPSRRIREDQWVEQARRLYNDKFRQTAE